MPELIQKAAAALCLGGHAQNFLGSCQNRGRGRRSRAEAGALGHASVVTFCSLNHNQAMIPTRSPVLHNLLGPDTGRWVTSQPGPVDWWTGLSERQWGRRRASWSSARDRICPIGFHSGAQPRAGPLVHG